jgi:hypothetical protein
LPEMLRGAPWRARRSLEQMRQFDAKCASENDNDDPVEKHQNRSGNGHGNDGADNQEDSDSGDCKDILVGHPALCSRSCEAARAVPRAPPSPIKLSNSPCSAARILCGAGYAVVPSLALARKRGEWSAERRTISRSALRRARALRKRARHSALHRGDFCSRGPRFLGRGICASPSPAGSLRKGHSAPRSGPRASRVRACEARPRAPLPTPTSRTPLEAPLMGQV